MTARANGFSTAEVYGCGRARGEYPYNGEVDVTVLLFASVAERAGARSVSLPWQDGDTVGDIRDRLVERYPALTASVPTLMYAVDEVYARATDPVRPGATIALIPPVSGG